MASTPAPLPSLGLLDGLGTAVTPAVDSPAFLPSMGLLGGLGGSGVLTITDINPGETDAVVTWTGTATHYRIDGGTTTALPDGTSPDTITGLTANTEYTSPGLELSGDGGSTWSTPVAFGTDNPGGGGGGIIVTLVVADASHAHTADGLTLTTGSTLVVSDALHAHTADNIALDVGSASLVVADALHAHTADNLTLTTSGDPTLTVARATHAHTADALLLTAQVGLAIADALQGHAVDNVLLDFISSDRVPGALSIRRRAALTNTPKRRPN